MGETWTTVDARVTKYASVAGSGGNNVAIQAPGNPNAGTIGGSAKRRVHCWTGDPGWRPREGDKSNATEHAKGKDEVVEIPYVHALTSLLLKAEIPGPHLDFWDFHSHGAAGFVALEKELAESPGESGIGWMNLFRLDGYEGAFNRGATIEFHGCNIGDEFEGEVFLYEVCARLLPKGGTAGASTAGGFAFGDLPLIPEAEKGGVYHPGGDWVTWEAKPEDPKANMIGKNIRFYHKLPEVISETKQRLDAAVKKAQSRYFKADARTKFDGFVKAARDKLKLDATPPGSPTHLDVCWARAFVYAAAKLADEASRFKVLATSDESDGSQDAGASVPSDSMALAVVYSMRGGSAGDSAPGSGSGEMLASSDAANGGSGDAAAPSGDGEGGGTGFSVSLSDVTRAIGMG